MCVSSERYNVRLGLREGGFRAIYHQGRVSKKKKEVILQDESQYRQPSERRLSPFLKLLTVTATTLRKLGVGLKENMSIFLGNKLNRSIPTEIHRKKSTFFCG